MSAPRKADGAQRPAKRKRKEKPVLAEAPTGSNAGNSKFARALGSTDFTTREKGLQALARWMALRSDLEEADMLKIWKGVFFCFWHSDKAPVQADLAQRLAGMLSSLPRPTAALYFGCFLTTMRREWPAIDYHRLDKFLMLVRKFLAAALALMRGSDWDPELVATYAAALQARVLAPPGDASNRAAGLTYHLADIIIPELRASCANGGAAGPSIAGRRRVAGDGKRAREGAAAAAAAAAQPPGAAIEALLGPFVEALRTAPEKAAVLRIRASVFDELAEEVASPSDGEPLARLDAAALSARLFDLGASPEVRARNREALYAASKALEAAAGGAKRRRAEAPAGGDGAAAAPAANGVAAAGPAAGSAGKKKVPKRKAGAEAAAEAAPAATPKKAAAGARAGAAAEAAPETPKQQRKPLTPPQQQQPAASPRTPVAEGGDKPAKKQKHKAADAAATPKQQQQQQQQQEQQQRQPQQQQVGFSTPQPAKPRPQAGGGGGGGGGAAAAHPSGAQSVPSKQAARGLRSVHAAASTPAGKRGVVINLRRNIYHKHGAPPPAPDVRTPPAAKPKGSALKRAQAPATAQPTARAAARLSLGEGGGAPGSAPGRVGGGGAKVTPGRLPRPKAASFF
ncbi:hypothetical protein Rsub_11025 [Raphidocelis subcapitata]|uniref:Uncharacterized protein n=1 Tax=Raphidocelis subcapitata TaxID=307507 RepID=A0A2V0PBZ7_9CHLO|nr:hypothetical protein Rsub_11025 [Raphidocelis subcapitata]|eukprot:GBF97378.1 hypothetical protein Rsub_11025 [Raphidocelis subcapitata]